LNREWGLLCDTAPDRRAVRDWAAPSRDRAAPAALVGVDGLHAAVRLLQRRGRANDRVAADPTPPGVAGPHSGLDEPEPRPARPSRLPGRAARKPAPPDPQPRSAPVPRPARPLTSSTAPAQPDQNAACLAAPGRGLLARRTPRLPAGTS